MDLIEENEDESMQNIGDAQRPVSVSSCTNHGDKSVHNATPHQSDAQLANHTPQEFDAPSQNSDLDDNHHTPENSDSENNESPEKSNDEITEPPENSNDEINGTPQNSPRRNNQSSSPLSPEHEHLQNNQMPHVETPRARRPRFKEFSSYRPKARGIDVIYIYV